MDEKRDDQFKKSWPEQYNDFETIVGDKMFRFHGIDLWNTTRGRLLRARVDPNPNAAGSSMLEIEYTDIKEHGQPWKITKYSIIQDVEIAKAFMKEIADQIAIKEGWKK